MGKLLVVKGTGHIYNVWQLLIKWMYHTKTTKLRSTSLIWSEPNLNDLIPQQEHYRMCIGDNLKEKRQQNARTIETLP